MSYWRCRRCEAENEEAVSACENCGAAATFGQSEKRALPAYRPVEAVQKPWMNPAARTNDRQQRCPEPGCTKTVGEHIAEFKRAGAIIERRSQRVRVDAQEA